MAQHDYNLENQTGFNFRQDLNNALAAIATNNSGATAPTPTYPHQWWFDTANDLLKIRNELNDAWVVAAKKVGNNYFVYSASGTAELPGITFTGNINTGFFSPASGVLGISAAGQERVRITSAGNIGVGGVTSPTEVLDVSGNVKVSGSVNSDSLSVTNNSNSGSLSVGGTSVIDSTRKLENVTGLKTVNGQSVLGTGDITRDLKTINGESILGTGNISTGPSGLQLIKRRLILDSTATGLLDASAAVYNFVNAGYIPDNAKFLTYYATAEGSDFTDLRDFWVCWGGGYFNRKIILGCSTDDTDQNGSAGFKLANSFSISFNDGMESDYPNSVSNSIHYYSVGLTRAMAGGTYTGLKIWITGYQL